MKLLLTIQEAAEAISMSESYVKKEIREKRLPKVPCGRSCRVRVSDLELWISRKLAGTPTDLDQSPADTLKNQVIEKTVQVRP